MSDDNPLAAIAVERGCGVRVEGGIYGECGMSAHGTPLEYFLVDPPEVVSKADFDLTEIGTKLVQVDGVWHVFDIVGSEDYPNVADFLEEARRFGVSRRLAKTLDFGKLTLNSRLVLLHARASVMTYPTYERDWQTVRPGQVEYHPCPKKIPEHDTIPTGKFPEQVCAGFWWNDVEGGKPRYDDPEMRNVVRQMPSFYYEGIRPPKDLSDPRDRGYQLAIFATFPLTRLAVVKASDGEGHKEAEHEARAADLPVDLVDE